ncbi:hypothetical protein GCM10022419_118190 [Nonomuraea rosea]|uniref:Uncharacterized protein n=1 Tax=Nonomuraea rosea TaxID=638574 RepID=A0ABP6ZNN3_9ACTN
MDPVQVGAIVSAVLVAGVTIVGAWLRSVVRRERNRDVARRDLVRRLPTGSRILDLGKRGMLIEFGPVTNPKVSDDGDR